MHKQILNEFRLNLTLSIAPGSRLLIAEERKEKDKNSSEPAITQAVRSNGKFYLPGSSLKGVFRSRAEFIASLLSNGQGVCHPFDDELTDPRPSCGKRFTDREKANQLAIPQRYVQACPVCQLFGHTLEAGRIRLTDFNCITPSPFLIIQPHVPIDRMSGGVQGVGQVKGRSLFQVEYIKNASFSGEIVLTNFSLWQIGLLGFLLQDLLDGLIRLGHKQTTGAGKMVVDSIAATVRVIAAPPAPGKFKGLNIALPEGNPNYQVGYQEIDIPGLTWARDGIWWQAKFTDQDALKPLWAATRPMTHQVLRDFKFDEKMDPQNVQNLTNDTRQEVGA